MPSVRKLPRSKYWYACITGPDGKQRQFSTGLTDRDEALAVATATERAAKKLHTEPHKLRAALDRIAEDYTPARDCDPVEWLPAWAESRRNECAESTLTSYKAMARESAEWFAANRIQSFSAITPARITELRDHWAKGRSAATANGKLKILRIALNAAVSEKLITINPADNLTKLREKKTKRREFRAAELQLLAPTLTGEWRAMFYLGLYTGQRVSDLATLRWSSVDILAGTVTFRSAKTDSLVCLPLSPQAVDALAALQSSDDPKSPVFVALAKLKRQARSNQFRELLAAVGLAEPVNHGKNEARTDGRREVSELSFHSLRHTTTSLLKSAGVSEAVAMAIVGHSSKAVSNSYTHLDLATIKAAIEKMPVF